jgi:hypothetical protein
MEVATIERFEFVEIVPPTNDASLRLTPDERGVIEAGKWVNLTRQIHRAKGRPVSAVRCGDLVGYAVEFGDSNEWLRGWALYANSFPLDATYRCKTEHTGRDNLAVDRMLSSLRVFESVR